MKKSCFLSFVILAFMMVSMPIFGQLNPPKDKELAARASAAYVLLKDLKAEASYSQALPHLHWLLKNTPEIHKSIYIYGVKVLDEVATQEVDKSRKKILQDSCMTVYDLRMQYFGEAANVLNRKMAKAYKFYANEPGEYLWMLNSFKKVYELNGDKVLNINTIGYFDIVRRYQLSGGTLDQNEILDIFYEIIKVLDEKIASGKHVDRLQEYKGKIIGMLTEIIDINCSFINNTFGNRIKENPQDQLMIKLMVKFSIDYDCDPQPMIAEAAEKLYDLQPDYSLALLNAVWFGRMKQLNKAGEYYRKAIEHTEDFSLKAEIWNKIGLIQAVQNEVIKARGSFLKALEFDPSLKKTHSYIGDLYYRSRERCDKKKSQVEDRAIYLAAYERYALAGNQKAMAEARKQFPSAADLHLENRKPGDSYKVGCWINETVTLRKRPAEF